MARSVRIEDLTDRTAAGGAFTSARKGTGGHTCGSVTAKFKDAAGAPARVLTIRGTNDPADSVGEVIATINAAADGSVTASWSNKAYEYVFWNIDAGADLTLDEIRLYLSGFPGTS